MSLRYVAVMCRWLVALALAVTACSSVVIPADDDDGPRGGAHGGGPSAGGSGAMSVGGRPVEGGGGSVPVPREIEIATVVPGWLQASELLVSVSSVDGALRQTFRGSELPQQVEVVDGDLVSYLFRSGDTSSEQGTPEQIEYVDSYRVRPSVTRIESLARPWEGHVFCDQAEPMELTVNVPALAGATSVFAQAGTGHFASLSNLPGSMVISVDPCVGQGPFHVLVLARSGADALSYELIEDVPFTPGGTLTVDAQVSQTATTTLTVEVVGAEGAASAGGHASWLGDDVFGHEGPWASMLTPSIPGLELPSFVPDGPFVYSVDIISPPHGFPSLFAQGSWGRDGGICTWSDFHRRGESAESFTFDALALAAPIPIADGIWDLEVGGERGTEWRVTHRKLDGNVSWSVVDDPTLPVLPIAFPLIPEELLPVGVVLPEAPFDVVRARHSRVRDSSYQELLASSAIVPELTEESRSAGPCP